MKVSAASQVIAQLVYVVGVASLFSLKVRTSPEIVLLLSLGSGVLFAAGVAPFVWRSGVVPPELDRALLRRVLWLSTPVIALMASQYVFASVDIVVLRVIRGQHDAGVYAVAYQAYTVLSGVAVTATAVFLPLFVSLRIGGRESLVDRYLTRIVPQALFLLAVVAGLAIPFLPALVPLVFGQAFAAASTPLCVLVVGLVFLFAAYSVAPILTLHERTRATAVINGVAALVNLVGDLLLVAVLHVGVVAPAIATTTSLVLLFAGFYWSARGALRSKASLPFLAAAPLVAGLVPTLLFTGAAGIGVGIVAALVVTAAVCLWRSPFQRDDIDLIAKVELPGPIKRVLVRVLTILVTRAKV